MNKFLLLRVAGGNVVEGAGAMCLGESGPGPALQSGRQTSAAAESQQPCSSAHCTPSCTHSATLGSSALIKNTASDLVFVFTDPLSSLPQNCRAVVQGSRLHTESGPLQQSGSIAPAEWQCSIRRLQGNTSRL